MLLIGFGKVTREGDTKLGGFSALDYEYLGHLRHFLPRWNIFNWFEWSFCYFYIIPPYNIHSFKSEIFISSILLRHPNDITCQMPTTFAQPITSSSAQPVFVSIELHMPKRSLSFLHVQISAMLDCEKKVEPMERLVTVGELQTIWSPAPRSNA